MRRPHIGWRRNATAVTTMTKLFLRHVAALVLFVLCCGYAHLLTDGLGTGHHHHCNAGEQVFQSNDTGGKHQTSNHW